MDISVEDRTPKELYKLLSGIVVPRPIALVSTKNKNNIPNVAPYSFFNVVTNDPPIVMFSIGERRKNQKDTLNNIEAHPEFVINIANVRIAESVHNAAANFKSGVSEFNEVNLTPIPTKVIDGVAVKESPIHIECKLDQIIKVGKGFMVLGQVVHFYIDDSIYLGNYKTNFQKLNPLARFAGNKYGEISHYMSLRREFNPEKVLKE